MISHLSEHRILIVAVSMAVSTMAIIKAIKTIYNGIEYRSRTEACWARFFDKLEIKHLYEHEVVDLGPDTYLPDFWLPDYKVWIEIKGWQQYIPHSKCYRLSIERSQKVLLIQGRPDNGKYVVDYFDGYRAKKFSFPIKVSEDEVKPTQMNFRFILSECFRDQLVLENSKGQRIELNKVA